MAKSTSGKLVSRVGAAGGGKTYRKTRPANFYGILVVICVLGLALVVYSRYEYQHPTKKHSTATAPFVGKTYYFAVAADDCGTALPSLTTDPTYKGSYHVEADDVVNLTPLTSASAGKNATLANFAANYPGLVTSPTELAIPGKGGVADKKTTFSNGSACPAGTRYAGQKARVVYAYWPTLATTKPTLTTDPATIHLGNEARITMAFVPKGVTPAAPSSTSVDAMVALATTPTTTTTAATTATTTPTTTTTSAPTTTTTTG